jgi:intron-binding protein aquarius
MEISPPKVGDEFPSMVRGEVHLDLESLPLHARREWSQIRQNEVIFLLSIKLEEPKGEQTMLEKLGIRFIRSAEVAQVLDEEGRPLKYDQRGDLDGRYLVPRKRTLRLRLDARQWKEDNVLSVSGKQEDIYDSINVVVRRRQEVRTLFVRGLMY